MIKATEAEGNNDDLDRWSDECDPSFDDEVCDLAFSQGLSIAKARQILEFARAANTDSEE